MAFSREQANHIKSMASSNRKTNKNKDTEKILLIELEKYNSPISEQRLIDSITKNIAISKNTLFSVVNKLIRSNTIILVRIIDNKNIIIHPSKPQNFRLKAPLL